MLRRVVGEQRPHARGVEMQRATNACTYDIGPPSCVSCKLPTQVYRINWVLNGLEHDGISYGMRMPLVKHGFSRIRNL
jgi:hypothetical protein